jgi:hypothetical protein
MLRPRVATMLGTLCVGASLVSSAHAEDLFEIQVFHSPIVAPTHFDLELHSNYAAAGPSVVPKGEVSSAGVLYEMIEPSYGIAPGWEVAAHIQQAFRPDGVLVWGGNKLRVMGMFTDDDPRARWRFAVNLEGGYQPRRFDPAQWGLELRPVVEWTEGAFDVDLNPVVAAPLGGDDAGIPQLQPSVALRVVLGDLLKLSAEYYAQLGPISRMPPVELERHYLFETVDVLRWREWIIHIGVGEGLTTASTRFVATSLVGRHF